MPVHIPSNPSQRRVSTPSLMATGFTQETIDQDIKDHNLAERAALLAEFINGKPVPDIWSKHILPLIEDLHGELLDKVISGTVHPHSLDSLRQFIHKLDSTHKLGVDAFNRWGRRHYQATQAGE